MNEQHTLTDLRDATNRAMTLVSELQDLVRSIPAYIIQAELAAKADRRALDELNLLLSSPAWPGASGLEDVCAIVRGTGRQEVPDAPHWERH